VTCSATSTVEVVHPPHVEKGWPNEKVLRWRVLPAMRQGKRVPGDAHALLSTSTATAYREEGGDDGAAAAEGNPNDIELWADMLRQVLKGWWSRMASSPDRTASVPSFGGEAPPGAAEGKGSVASSSGGASPNVAAAVDSVFATNDFLASGWLWKQGERWKNWKRRWFELTTISFTYYDVPEGKVLGDIPVRSGTVIEWEHEAQKKGTRYSFHVLTPGRTYHVYSVDKADFDAWEAAFHTLGCAVQPFEKMPRRERSGSLSRVRLGRGGGGGGLLSPDSLLSMSKLSRSHNDLSDEGGKPRQRAVTVAGGGGASPALFRKHSHRAKRLQSAPTSRPEQVVGQSAFRSFAEFHRHLCPPCWRGQPGRGGGDD